MLNLGAAIRSERSELGISQDELARRSGLHRTYISDLERGTRNPSVESVEKLAAALQISMSALFERAGDGDDRSRHAVEILLVEDNQSDVELTLQAFQKAHLANPVHVLRDGREALDYIFGQTFQNRAIDSHVILLDLNLPNVSGIDVLARLKADERTRDIPVIILTSSEHERDISACRRLGCAEYIIKPVGFQNFSQITSRLGLAWSLVSNHIAASRR